MLLKECLLIKRNFKDIKMNVSKNMKNKKYAMNF